MIFEKNSFLATELKNGNERAYEFLMESFYQKLCGYANTLTNDKSLAEDIVQNVFVKIWVNKKNINPDFTVKNYLFKSVYNEFIDQYRRNKPVIYLEKKYLESINLVVENEQKDISELIVLVNKEIENLPPKGRRIFLLSKKEGLSHVEISEYLNISIKTIESHMTIAFKRLSEKLGDKIKPILFLLFDFKNQFHSSNAKLRFNMVMANFSKSD